MKVIASYKVEEKTLTYEEILKEEGWYKASDFYLLVLLDANGCMNVRLAVDKYNRALGVSESHSWAAHKDFVRVEGFSITI